MPLTADTFRAAVLVSSEKVGYVSSRDFRAFVTNRYGQIAPAIFGVPVMMPVTSGMSEIYSTC